MAGITGRKGKAACCTTTRASHSIVTHITAMACWLLLTTGDDELDMNCTLEGLHVITISQEIDSTSFGHQTE